jgi:sugar (pentulose or hexulose) kinase
VLLGLRSLGVIDSPEQVDEMIELSREITPNTEAHQHYLEIFEAQKQLYHRLFEVPE